jgi:hypothetical protein
MLRLLSAVVLTVAIACLLGYVMSPGLQDLGSGLESGKRAALSHAAQSAGE